MITHYLQLIQGCIKSPSWITAWSWWRGLHNSMKLWAMLCRATQDRRVVMKSSDKMWYTGEGNGKPLKYIWGENPRNCIKKHKGMTLKDEPSRLIGVLYATRKSKGQWLIAPERMKWLDQSGNDTHLWMCLVTKVKFNAVRTVLHRNMDC